MATSTIRRLSEDDMLKTLIECVQERGEDYVYERGVSTACLMVHGTDYNVTETGGFIAQGDLKPGCIIGLFLHKLGVPLKELSEHEGSVANLGVQDVALAHGLDLGAVTHRLTRVQCRQDEGNAWGRAVRLGLDKPWLVFA